MEYNNTNSTVPENNIEKLRNLAEQGNVDAQYNLGLCYAEGNGVDEDWKKSIELFEKIQDKLDSLKISEGRKTFVKNALLAEKGDSEAQYKLGTFYSFEHILVPIFDYGVRQNWRKVNDWYTKAAEQGHKEAIIKLPEAQYQLGMCYEKGKGVEIDWEKAIELYSKAADQGCAEAKMKLTEVQYKLGMFYAKGKGGKQGWQQAIKLFEKIQDKLVFLDIDENKKAFVQNAVLAEKGSAEAQYQLAMCYAEGNGVDADWEKAIELFDKIQDKNISKDEKAFVKNALLAEKGDAKAQYKLGICYAEGRHVYPNWQKAVYWYAKAADQGHSEAKMILPVAQYYLGMCYAEGHGVDEDWKKTIELFEKIQDKLDSLSICKNEKAFVKKALLAEKGNAEAQYQLGNIFYDDSYFDYVVDSDWPKAVEWYTKAADQGHAEAQYQLGNIYSDCSYFTSDYGVEPDLQKAIEWYTKAADQGHAEAQYQLGNNYSNKYGINRDLQKAIEWYTKAADQGHAESQYQLGNIYVSSVYGEKHNLQKAIEWYTKAAGQGHVRAQINLSKAQYQLGICYAEGKGVEQNWQKAAELFEKIKDKLDVLSINWHEKVFVKNFVLAEKGDAHAQYQLGMCYAEGIGIEQDWQKAVKLFEKIKDKLDFLNINEGEKEFVITALWAEKGDAWAQYQLGMCYVEGKFVKEDWGKAIELFDKIQDKLDSLNIAETEKEFVKNALLAEKGDAEAKYQLGICYVEGIVLIQNLQKAICWYAKAADQGHMEAQYQLAKIYSGNQKVFKRSAYGEKQDWGKAVYWYTKAADQGHKEAANHLPEAQYQLGDKYYYDDYDSKNGFVWYKKAAEKGHARAQYKLGKYYDLGIDVEKDKQKAIEWYKKAADQGHVEARARLKELANSKK